MLATWQPASGKSDLSKADPGVHNALINLMLIRPKPSVILICSELETYSRPPASLVTQILGGGDEHKKSLKYS